MTEKQQPFGEPANDTLDWVPLVKEDGLWIHWPAENRLENLGPVEAAFEKMAEAMAAQDFGER